MTLPSGNIENAALFKLSYGLFLLTAKDSKDNGCIINTVTQVTSTPNRITIAVNKQNYTHDIIMKTKVFNVSVLTEDVPFTLFQNFGFQSGRTADKFAGCTELHRSANGLLYLNKFTNAFISGQVYNTVDCGTHTLFIADVCEAKILSQKTSVTYEYYFSHIKPKPEPKAKGYVCKICGYIHEGDSLPDDFICPICKHGAADFEPLI